MKFSMERPVKIVMLGAGGTGGHILSCMPTSAITERCMSDSRSHGLYSRFPTIRKAAR